jgi:mRNA interferase RelE/StbE
LEIRYAKIALKALQSYDRPTRERIRGKIIGLTQTPPSGDIKPIAGKDSCYRLRVGKFRIKYEYLVEEGKQESDGKGLVKVLHIIDLDSRGDIYK